jgi:hypothetical protein
MIEQRKWRKRTLNYYFKNIPLCELCCAMQIVLISTSLHTFKSSYTRSSPVPITMPPSLEFSLNMYLNLTFD